MPPIVYLSKFYDSQNFHLFDVLLNNGASVNQIDSNGYTCLLYAVKRNNMDMVKFFLQKKCDPTLVDFRGRNVIHHVVQPRAFASYENVDILNLLSKSFDINV